MAKFFSDREIRAVAIFLPLAGLLITALVLVRPSADPEAARRAEAAMETRRDSVVLRHFDPNTATLDELLALGLSKHEAVSLLKYRAAGKVFRIPEDLALCYGIGDSLYRRLAPWVRIGRKYAIAPEEYRTGRILPEPLAPQPFRIDTVSVRYLRAIGALSKRQAEAFIRWRDLSGIYDMEELRDCYVVSDSVASALEPYVIFPERKPRPIEEPVELNTADSAALRSVSGIGPKTVLKLYNVAQSADGPALDKACARFPSFREDLRFIAEMRARPLHPVTALELIVDHYRPVLESRYPEDWPRRQQGLEEILQMASGYNDLDLFLADLALDSPDEEDEDNEGRITLSTVHSAKGLEWNAVLIIDLVEDRFPSRHALARPEDFEEERRLMYVACTRARQELDLYSPATIYSKAEQGTQHVAQSPFVRELPAGLTEEWVESYGGGLSKRARGGMFADPFGGRPAPSGPGAGFGRGRHTGLAAPAGLSPAQRLAATRSLQDADDCQLPPDERPGGAAGSGRPAASAAPSAAAHARARRAPVSRRAQTGSLPAAPAARTARCGTRFPSVHTRRSHPHRTAPPCPNPTG